MSTDVPLGDDYRGCRERLSALLLTRATTEWRRPVPACPGWDVKAVISHVVGNIEDGMAGRLSGGPPDESQTAAQIVRHAGDAPEQLLATWGELAAIFEPVVTTNQIFPIVMDVLAHEHDIRGALGEPGGRDDELMGRAAERLISVLALPVNLEFDLGDAVVATAPVAGATHRVSTSAFEVFRLRLGRRSLEQVASLAWDTVPDRYLDNLFVFGPRSTALVE